MGSDAFLYSWKREHLRIPSAIFKTIPDSHSQTQPYGLKVLSGSLRNRNNKRESSSHPVCGVAQLCPTLCNPVDGSSPASSVRGIFQARTLQWVLPFPSADLRTCSSCIGRQILYCCTPWEAPARAIASQEKATWLLNTGKKETLQKLLSCLTTKIGGLF